MEQKIVWLQGSGNPENPNHLATIGEWLTVPYQLSSITNPDDSFHHSG
jgi:hypothetical protein